jgi:hypothetical protein
MAKKIYYEVFTIDWDNCEKTFCIYEKEYVRETAKFWVDSRGNRRKREETHFLDLPTAIKFALHENKKMQKELEKSLRNLKATEKSQEKKLKSLK